jgi:hypothetical protein
VGILSFLETHRIRDSLLGYRHFLLVIHSLNIKLIFCIIFPHLRDFPHGFPFY